MSANVSNITEDIGGFPYILNYLGIYLPYSLISLIAVIIGIVGNVLIITAVLIHKELRKNPTCILITNLAISDMVISLFVNSGTIVGVFAGKKFFDQNMAFCVFISAACLIACGTSLLTMGILAFNRYICIFYNQKYNKYFSVTNTLISCFCSWILGILVDVPNFIPDVGGHVYDPKTLSCLFDRLKVPVTLTVAIGCVIIPCSLIGLLYMRIFCHAYEKRAKVTKVRDNTSSNGQSSYRNKIEAVKIAKSLFASFFIFALCWFPVSIIFIIGKDDQLPIAAHTFTNLPAHINSAINPIFYGVFNPKMRQGYQNLFRLITCNRFFSENSNKDSTSLSSKKQLKRVSLSNSLKTDNKDIPINAFGYSKSLNGQLSTVKD